jgi:glucose/arabinose dehydrogenase
VQRPIFISRHLLLVILFASLTLPLGACNERESATVEQTFGPSPALTEPETSILPTINVAKAIGWPAGGKPVAARGMAVNAFATGLDHPRTLLVLPNGDVLVAETNAPERPEETSGIKGFITTMVMRRAGVETQTANRITLLRDANNDGVAEFRSVFLEGLNSPFGMAVVGDDFYVANSDAIMRFPYRSGDTRITAPGVKVADLPAGPLNHHWTKDLTAHPDGTKLYATVFVPFVNGVPSGKPQDVLTGFLSDEGEAQGRPVGVAIDKHGALLVADDVGNAIWRVTPAAKSTAR